MLPHSMCAAVLALYAAGLVGALNAPTDPTPTPICGLEGFHLNILQDGDYWQFDLEDKTHCIMQDNLTVNDIKTCTIYFSVCKPLPASICHGITNSSTCEVVTLANGTQLFYSIGDYRGSNEFGALGGDVVGFTTLRQGSQPVDDRLCTSVYETFLVWRCDETKVWSPQNPDVNGYFISSTRVNPSSSCYLRVDLAYSGACYTAPTLTPDTCQLEPYSFVGLASQPYWSATVSNDICYNEGSIGCSIFISFCGALPLNIHSGCYGAAICQIGNNLDNTNYGYSMGLYKTAKYTGNPGSVGSGFHLDVENGSKPEDKKCDKQGGISTRVIFLCDRSAQWTGTDLPNTLHIVRDPLTPCVYSITLRYDGACEPIPPQSFVGWILIGIFFFVVMVYLFVGAGFEYFVKGARGVEVIPNYAFWILFFSLVLEGCKFSFNAITCFQFEDKIKLPLRGSGRSGVDYDKI